MKVWVASMPPRVVVTVSRRRMRNSVGEDSSYSLSIVKEGAESVGVLYLFLNQARGAKWGISK